MFESIISVGDTKTLLPLFGPRDQNLRVIRDSLGVAISARDDEIRVTGDEEAVGKATQVLERLKDRVTRHGMISRDEVAQTITETTGRSARWDSTPIDVAPAGKRIKPRTPGQHRYVEAMRNHEIVLCEGPAGTGKKPSSSISSLYLPISKL